MPLAPPSVPPPSGMPKPAISSGHGLDPNNPLAAVAQPFKPSTPPAPVMAHAQRIEVDDAAVFQARSSARKQGLVIGLLFAVVLGGIGWVGGNASQQGAARTQGVHDAHDLAADLLKAKASLDAMKTKVQDGGKSLIGERKFPADLSKTLSDMIVDFNGDKRSSAVVSSGVPMETTKDLFDFITRVQALNDKKDLVVGLLSKLQRPITEELARAPGQLPILYVVIVDKDTPGGGTRIAPLVTPIAPDDKNGVPNELTFTNPFGAGNVKLPHLNDVKIPKDGAAIPIVPTSFDKVCPAKEKGQIAQLVSTMNSLMDDIQGARASDSGDAVTDSKPGLSETAGKLAGSALSKVN